MPLFSLFSPLVTIIRLQQSGSVLRNLGEIKCSREYHTPQVHHPGEVRAEWQWVMGDQRRSNFPSDSQGNVLGLAAIESSYLTQAYPGPTAWDDPDIPPLMVLNEYLVRFCILYVRLSAH